MKNLFKLLNFLWKITKIILIYMNPLYWLFKLYFYILNHIFFKLPVEIIKTAIKESKE